MPAKVAGTHKYASYFPLENAVTVSNIPIPPYTFELDKAKRQWPHLRCIQGSNLIEVVPSLVIGKNNALLILANRIVSGPKKAPVGWRTRLGWTVSGSFDKSQEEGRFNFTYLCGEDDRLHDLIKSSSSTENFGAMIPASKGVNVEENRAKLPEFVANRVWEIREISDSCQWRWVPTKENAGRQENVADQATRMSSEITGPTFLRLPTEQFPEEKDERSQV